MERPTYRKFAEPTMRRMGPAGNGTTLSVSDGLPCKMPVVAYFIFDQEARSRKFVLRMQRFEVAPDQYAYNYEHEIFINSVPGFEYVEGSTKELNVLQPDVVAQIDPSDMQVKLYFTHWPGDGPYRRQLYVLRTGIQYISDLSSVSVA